MSKKYTVEEVAEFLGYSPSTIAKWCREGKIKATKVKGRWLIPEREFLKLFAEVAGFTYTFARRYRDYELNIIYEKTGGRCFYCGQKLVFTAYGDVQHPRGWEVDHVKPRSRGGSDDLKNLVPACISCNRQKGNHYKLRDLIRSVMLTQKARKRAGF